MESNIMFQVSWNLKKFQENQTFLHCKIWHSVKYICYFILLPNTSAK
jgi:hypothetical protein